MKFENLINSNNIRVGKLVEIHKKELLEIEQQLRIIQKTKIDKLASISKQHDVWLDIKQEEISRLQSEVDEKNRSHANCCNEIENRYSKYEEAFLLRKNATQAYLEIANKIDVRRKATDNQSTKKSAQLDPTSRALSLLIREEDRRNVA